MDFFKEYGMTQEEIINTLSDAINCIDSLSDSSDYPGLSDRLMDSINVLKRSWNMED